MQQPHTLFWLFYSTRHNLLNSCITCSLSMYIHKSKNVATANTRRALTYVCSVSLHIRAATTCVLLNLILLIIYFIHDLRCLRQCAARNPLLLHMDRIFFKYPLQNMQESNNLLNGRSRDRPLYWGERLRQYTQGTRSVTLKAIVTVAS